MPKSHASSQRERLQAGLVKSSAKKDGQQGAQRALAECEQCVGKLYKERLKKTCMKHRYFETCITARYSLMFLFSRRPPLPATFWTACCACGSREAGKSKSKPHGGAVLAAAAALSRWPRRGAMASKASREATKMKALQQVQRLFAKKVRTSPAAVAATAGEPLDPRDLPPIEALMAPANHPDAVAGPSKKIYHSTSLCCLRPAHWPRRPAIFFVENRLFDSFILLTIMANCATMAWQSPLDPTDTWKAAFIDSCEWAYLFIFTFELLVKVLAYGLAFHQEAYLRDPWCQLDFVVVTLAWLPIIFPNFGNYSASESMGHLIPPYHRPAAAAAATLPLLPCRRRLAAAVLL